MNSSVIGRGAIGKLVFEIVVSVALPFAMFAVLQPKMGDVRALIASSIPPLVWSAVEIAWKRRIDAISLLVLVGIVLGLAAFAGGGSVRFLQLRENLVNGLIGIVFVGSALIGKPIIFLIARAGAVRQSPEKAAEAARLFEAAAFRRSVSLVTYVWGFGLLVQTAIACALVFALPIRTYLIVGPLVGYASLIPLVVWTWWYMKLRK